MKARLVAVSKLKSVDHIKAAYEAGQRVFGENYVQEMVEKAPQLPLDIQWHMIGHLTASNVKHVLKVPNLSVVETVDTLKVAKKLNELLEVSERHLAVFVQVNTSGEESKSGTMPGQDTLDLCRAIHETMPRLRLAGLMCIGKYVSNPPDVNIITSETSKEENAHIPPGAEDFVVLSEQRNMIAKELQIPLSDLELSMGMSHDWALAMKYGSTNVRVGSAIFGERPKKN